MRRYRSLSGFTLLEILIVLAVLTILAAIGTAMLGEAQTKSKVARAIGDMRNLSIALEAYCGDYGKYPTPYPHVPDTPDNTTGTRVPNSLSTPLGYIVNVNIFVDPFAVDSIRPPETCRYGYVTRTIQNHIVFQPPPQGLTPEWLKELGAWRLDSLGPDRTSPAWPNEPRYDPTNGSGSAGDVYRNHSTSDEPT